MRRRHGHRHEAHRLGQQDEHLGRHDAGECQREACREARASGACHSFDVSLQFESTYIYWSILTDIIY